MARDKVRCSWRGPGWLTVAVVVLALAGPGGAADLGRPLATGKRVTEATIRGLGVTPDTEGIVAFLSQLYADHAEGGVVERLIADLDGSDYHRRRRAEVRLAASAAVSKRMLRALSREHPNPEVRMRAGRALSRRVERAEPPPALTVLRYAAAKRLGGVAPSVIRLMTRLEDPVVWEQAFYVVHATAGANERAAYRGFAESGDPAVASLGLLAAWIGGEPNAARAADFLDAEAAEVRLAAGWTLLHVGDPRGLSALAGLLDHESQAVRRVAARGLQSATEQRFGYAPTLDPDEQKRAIGDWRKWVADRGAKAKLKRPRLEAAGGRQFNRTLIAMFQRGRVVEYDAAGKIVWQTAIERPYGVQGLPNGHRLIGSFEAKAVYEYDDAGELVWRKEGLPGGVMSVQRLANGNTLLACSDAQQVLELDEDGKTVWRVSVRGRPVQAQRLANGRTLVTLPEARRVAELDPAGRIVWSIDDLGNVQSAVRLTNGRTLVTLADAGTTVLYDREGDPVRKIKNLSVPLHAQVIAGGIAIIEQRKGLTIVGSQGDRELRIDLSDQNPILARFHRY